MSFESFGLHPSLMRAVQESGYTQPTPIQSQAIPVAMRGADIIGSAQTGTGKTAAFLLPLMHRLLEGVGRPPQGKSSEAVKGAEAGEAAQAQARPERRGGPVDHNHRQGGRYSGAVSSRRGRGCKVLILTPTRELALQIDQQRAALGVHNGLMGTTLIGGVSFEPQIRALRAGVEIIVACPGRMLDHLERGNLDLSGVEAVVLDEADRMLDMGFLPDVRRCLSALPNQRQTLLFTATLPTEIEALSAEFLRKPVRIAAGGNSRPPDAIKHVLYPVPGYLKFKLLTRLLETEDMTSTIVFVRTRRRADRIAAMLDKRGYPTGTLHGDMSQNQRVRSLEDFRRGKTPLLVATDIAARGLDVQGISHVVNFDLPKVSEDYVHRIGRTGRAHAIGDAISLVDGQEEPQARAIEKMLGQRLERKTLESFAYDAPPPEVGESVSGRSGSSGSRDQGSRDSRSTHGGPGRNRREATSARRENSAQDRPEGRVASYFEDRVANRRPGPAAQAGSERSGDTPRGQGAQRPEGQRPQAPYPGAARPGPSRPSAARPGPSRPGTTRPVAERSSHGGQDAARSPGRPLAKPSFQPRGAATGRSTAKPVSRRGPGPQTPGRSTRGRASSRD